MAFYEPAFPKPGRSRKPVEPVRTYRDGREVIRTSTRAGRELYKLRTRIMWERQGGLCGLQISKKCMKKLPLRLAHFDHTDGRGLGGSSGGAGKRDDRILIDDKPVNCAACFYCNAEKGSRRLDLFEELTPENSMASKTSKLVPIDKAPVAVTPLGLLQIAVQQGADVDKLAQLLELQERWQANQARQAYNAAMAKFKQEPPKITKNKHVKFDDAEYDHATLDHVVDAITETLSAVGISHKWRMSQSPEISVTCVLTHEMGHSEETTLKAGPDTSGGKNSIQAIGSTVTYLERYTLLAAVGMAAAGTDNDGRGSDEEQKPKTSEARVVECLSWIKEAPDLVALQRSFVGSVQEAQKINDKDAEAQYIRAKDQRKRVLRANL
jgi:ERF superfamily